MHNTLKVFMTLVVLAAFGFSTAAVAGDVHKFIGVAGCKMCHNSATAGKQYDVWAKTKHAKAFEVLKSDEANKIAKEKGFKTPAAETPECLTCHVSGGMKSADAYDVKFSKDEGVGCESCHGGGFDYKTKHQKPEHKAGLKGVGLMLPKVADGSAEKFCVTCHNSKSPTFKEFKFASMWEKIKHPKPAQ